MIYAALGDSITYGYSASSPERSFVSLIRRALLRQQPVHVLLQAKPGWTSKQLWASLSRVPECLWDEARLVTVLVGGNDMLRAAPWLWDGNMGRMLKIADRYRDHLTKIVQRVKRPAAVVVVGTLYNPFPHSGLAEACTELLNQTIRQVAAREQVWVADLGKLFHRREGELIHGFRRGILQDFRFFRNPIHPNDHGHELIAQAFLRVYRRAVSRDRLAARRRAR
ncbi:lipase [Alicyclobacillus cellulosilyticus]|uniref:Lipase n=1 Tax=Alicyclobacillus cellulosilyticus TaxID=1003997 RepID=A0A917NHE6_9BACL|nr:SGNH/GDSL hydrolase family protein [Alicyclobacillus cellulosilyticus]GGJ00776.1 lipase [Alicyclobacillus cellulosilyticus]